MVAHTTHEALGWDVQEAAGCVAGSHLCLSSCSRFLASSSGSTVSLLALPSLAPLCSLRLPAAVVGLAWVPWAPARLLVACASGLLHAYALDQPGKGSGGGGSGAEGMPGGAALLASVQGPADLAWAGCTASAVVLAWRAGAGVCVGRAQVPALGLAGLPSPCCPPPLLRMADQPRREQPREAKREARRRQAAVRAAVLGAASPAVAVVAVGRSVALVGGEGHEQHALAAAACSVSAHPLRACGAVCEAGGRIRTLEGGRLAQELHWHAHGAEGLAHSRDGQHLYSGGREGVLVQWQLASGRRHFLPGFLAPLACLAPAGDAKHVAVGLASNSLHYVNTATMEVARSRFGLARPPTPGRAEAAVDGGGLVVVEGRPGTLQWYCPAAGRQVRQLQVVRNPDACAPACLARVARFRTSPDGVWLATVHERAHPQAGARPLVALQLWRMHPARQQFVLNTLVEAPHGPGVRVTSLAFHPHGAALTSTAADGSHATWRLGSRRRAAAYRGEEGEAQLAWSAGSRGAGPQPALAAAVSEDGSVLAVVHEGRTALWSTASPSSPSSSSSSPRLLRWLAVGGRGWASARLAGGVLHVAGADGCCVAPLAGRAQARRLRCPPHLALASAAALPGGGWAAAVHARTDPTACHVLLLDAALRPTALLPAPPAPTLLAPPPGLRSFALLMLSGRSLRLLAPPARPQAQAEALPSFTSAFSQMFAAAQPQAPAAAVPAKASAPSPKAAIASSSHLAPAVASLFESFVRAKLQHVPAVQQAEQEARDEEMAAAHLHAEVSAFTSSVQAEASETYGKELAASALLAVFGR